MRMVRRTLSQLLSKESWHVRGLLIVNNLVIILVIKPAIQTLLLLINIYKIMPVLVENADQLLVSLFLKLWWGE